MRKQIHLDRHIPAGLKVFKKTEIIVILISSAVTILISAFNYFYIEQIKNDLLKQSLNLDSIKINIDKASQENARQMLELERIKVEIAKSSEANSEIGTRVSQSRLDMDRQTEKNNKIKDQAKLNLDSNSGQRDEARLSVDFTKLLNELRPNLQINCNSIITKDNYIVIECSFKNLGLNKIIVYPIDIFLLDENNKQIIHNAILKTEDLDSNQIINLGSNRYTVFLTPEGQKLKKHNFKLSIKAITNQSSIDLTKRLSKGLITDEELNDAATQLYQINLYDN